jgi:TPR repeat protein
MTLQGFHLPLVARALLLSLLMLLGLSSHAQTVAESMALFDDGKTKEAVAQLTKLAQDGDPEAQNLLGVLYDNGQGVVQDYPSARAWFEKAAARGLGDQSAIRAISELTETMSSEAIDQGQALAKQCIAKGYQGCDALTR